MGPIVGAILLVTFVAAMMVAIGSTIADEKQCPYAWRVGVGALTVAVLALFFLLVKVTSRDEDFYKSQLQELQTRLEQSIATGTCR